MKSVLHLLNLITPTFILLVAVILYLFIKMPKACPGHELPAWVSFCPKADRHCVLSSAIMCLITCSSALEWLQLFQIPTSRILFFNQSPCIYDIKNNNTFLQTAYFVRFNWHWYETACIRVQLLKVFGVFLLDSWLKMINPKKMSLLVTGILDKHVPKHRKKTFFLDWPTSSDNKLIALIKRTWL